MNKVKPFHTKKVKFQEVQKSHDALSKSLGIGLSLDNTHSPWLRLLFILNIFTIFFTEVEMILLMTNEHKKGRQILIFDCSTLIMLIARFGTLTSATVFFFNRKKLTDIYYLKKN